MLFSLRNATQCDMKLVFEAWSFHMALEGLKCKMHEHVIFMIGQTLIYKVGQIYIYIFFLLRYSCLFYAHLRLVFSLVQKRKIILTNVANNPTKVINNH